jgi:hypothetical protein
MLSTTWTFQTGIFAFVGTSLSEHATERHLKPDSLGRYSRPKAHFFPATSYLSTL